MPNSPTPVAGVDGCPKGWIAVVLEDGRFARAELAATFVEILTQLTDAPVIGVDIPIGLPGGPDPRPADLKAKKLLGPLQFSVFLTPPRPILEAPTYAEANRLSKKLFDRGISTQSYALRPKILEVDVCAASDNRVYEVHPELSFRAMNGSPLAYSKKNWNGLATRIKLLADQGIVIPNNLGATGAIPADDVIDAAAAAWSALRIAGETASHVGEPVADDRPRPGIGPIWF